MHILKNNYQLVQTVKNTMNAYTHVSNTVQIFKGYNLIDKYLSALNLQ